MKPDEHTENEPQWAVVELMGHNRYGGKVSKDNQFGTSMLRIDVPLPGGGFATQLVNPDSLYRITFTDEEIARAAAKAGSPAPISQWEARQLLGTREEDPEPADEYEDDEDLAEIGTVY